MRELVRTNDPVLVSAIEALLNGAGIAHVVLDRNMSVLEGSVGILACRILVSDDDAISVAALTSSREFSPNWRIIPERYSARKASAR